MNTTPPPTIEQGVNALVSDVRQKVTETYRDCEDRVRVSPGKAIMAAVAAGYVLHRLPIRSLLVAQVRMMAAVAPPALFVYGAAKVCEFLQREAASKRDRSAVLAASRPFEAS